VGREGKVGEEGGKREGEKKRSECKEVKVK